MLTKREFIRDHLSEYRICRDYFRDSTAGYVVERKRFGFLGFSFWVYFSRSSFSNSSKKMIYSRKESALKEIAEDLNDRYLKYLRSYLSSESGRVEVLSVDDLEYIYKFGDED